MQYPRTMSNNTYHSGTITRFSGNHSGNTTLFSGNKREPPPFFHSDTNTWPRSGPFCWQNPCSSYNGGTDLVVLEYILTTLFQRRTNLLGSQDSEEAM